MSQFHKKRSKQKNEVNLEKSGETLSALGSDEEVPSASSLSARTTSNQTGVAELTQKEVLAEVEIETAHLERNTSPSTEKSLVRSLAQNPAAVYLATLRPSGRRTMRHYLDVIASLASNGECQDAFSFDWAGLRYQHTAALSTALGQHYKPATVKIALAALRRVLKEAYKLGQLGGDEYQAAISLAPVKGEKLLRGRALDRLELAALFKICRRDKTLAGRRDGAILGVLYGAGLRRTELTNLDLADFDPLKQSLKIREGKGGKERLAYLGGGAEAALKDWLGIRGNQAGPLFYPLKKGGSIVSGQRLTSQAIYFVLKARAEEAGVKDFSPHDLRRTFISDLLEAGADIATVQKLAGHSDISTTARYDRRGEETKLRAVNLLFIPYQTEGSDTGRESGE